MDLGAFSLSLAVSDLAASRDFYAKLGFVPAGGDEAQGWLILRGPSLVLGLFQGIIPRNTLTFTPGWDRDAAPLAAFTDVRTLQRQVEAAGLVPDQRVDPSGSGPGHFMLTDPDGNPVLIDQHL